MAQLAYDDEARITGFRDLIHSLHVRLAQAGLAERMGTNQSGFARIDEAGTRTPLETLEKPASAGGQ